MAEVSGGAAYKGYQKIDNGISQGLQHWGGIKARENAAQKLADERAGVREQQRKDDWMKNHQWEDFENEITNYENFDDLSRTLFNDVRNQTTDLYRQSIKLRNEGKTLEADTVWNQYLKTKGAFKDFAKIEPILAKHNESFVNDFKAGKVSGVDDDYLSFIQAQENVDVKPKVVNGTLKYQVAFKDKEGKITDVKEMSHYDLVNNKYSYIPKNDVLGKEGIVTNILKTVGKRTYDETRGLYKYTLQKWDDKAIALVDSYVDGLVENDRAMSDLLFQATGKKKFGNIKYRRRGEQDNFTDSDKKQVKDWIKTQVEGGYDSKQSKTFESGKAANIRGNEANRISQGRLNETIRHNKAMEGISRDKMKDEDKVTMSRLNYDADQFVNGDYSGLLGRFKNEFDEETNIRKVVKAPNGNYVVAITETGEKIEIPNTKRGFLEFKIRGNAEYKKFNPDGVMSNPAIKYRNDNVTGSDISDIAGDLFNEEGKPKVDDEKILQSLKRYLDIEGEDNFTWSGNSLKINGKNVDTSTKAKFEKTLKKALETNKDPLGLGI